MYRPLDIDRENLTIMGVQCPDLKTLNSVANALGSNMFEGLEPTPALIQFYMSHRDGDLAGSLFVDALKLVL
jgi:putative transcriptional regulator